MVEYSYVLDIMCMESRISSGCARVNLDISMIPDVRVRDTETKFRTIYIHKQTQQQR